MRVIASILLFLTGCGLAAYSYIGSFFDLASEVELSVREGNDRSAFATIVDFVLGGDAPQIPG
ncbi:MAG: hypothetical protein JKX88_11645, partial [Marinicaulis sp.]|nr:hypothetical protein [Marinicaulis sp.]